MRFLNVSLNDSPNTPDFSDTCVVALARLALVCVLVWAWGR